jgi:hypothetical protein
MKADDNLVKFEETVLKEYNRDGMGETLCGWLFLELALSMAVFPGSWPRQMALLLVLLPPPLILVPANLRLECMI